MSAGAPQPRGLLYRWASVLPLTERTPRITLGEGDTPLVRSAALERDNLAACYTFGSPRVGTSNFDVVVKCPHYRVVNDNDVVPGIPFPSPWGYQHSGDARLIKPALRDRSILRRGRAAIVEISIALFSFVIAVFGNRIFVIDQHMIWNYRRHLEGIADAKSRQVAGSPPSQRLPPR